MSLGHNVIGYQLGSQFFCRQVYLVIINCFCRFARSLRREVFESICECLLWDLVDDGFLEYMHLRVTVTRAQLLSLARVLAEAWHQVR